MKISLENGVVLNVYPLRHDGQRKTRNEVITEAAVRCRNVAMGGVLLDDLIKPVARYNAFGELLA